MKLYVIYSIFYYLFVIHFYLKRVTKQQNINIFLLVNKIKSLG